MRSVGRISGCLLLSKDWISVMLWHQAPIKVLGGLDTSGAEGMCREFHKPVVVQIDRFDDVSLPLLWLAEVDWHS